MNVWMFCNATQNSKYTRYLNVLEALTFRTEVANRFVSLSFFWLMGVTIPAECQRSMWDSIPTDYLVHNHIRKAWSHHPKRLRVCNWGKSELCYLVGQYKFQYKFCGSVRLLHITPWGSPTINWDCGENSGLSHIRALFCARLWELRTASDLTNLGPQGSPNQLLSPRVKWMEHN